MEIRIIGILVIDRVKEAGRTQEVLSDYGNIIQTRFGVHELSNEKCSRAGVIVLHLSGDPEQWNSLERDLSQIGGIQVQRMSFEEVPVSIGC